MTIRPLIRITATVTAMTLFLAGCTVPVRWNESQIIENKSKLQVGLHVKLAYPKTASSSGEITGKLVEISETRVVVEMGSGKVISAEVSELAYLEYYRDVGFWEATLKSIGVVSITILLTLLTIIAGH